MYAQNLIVNPSFEDIDTNYLPCDDYYRSANAFNKTLKSGWTNPDNGTSDIISLLVKPKCIVYAYPNTNPFTTTGEQMPKTGKAMAGR